VVSRHETVFVAGSPVVRRVAKENRVVPVITFEQLRKIKVLNKNTVKSSVAFPHQAESFAAKTGLAYGSVSEVAVCLAAFAAECGFYHKPRSGGPLNICQAGLFPVIAKLSPAVNHKLQLADKLSMMPADDPEQIDQVAVDVV